MCIQHDSSVNPRREGLLAVMSFCSFSIVKKACLGITPTALSEYFNKIWTGHKIVGPE